MLATKLQRILLKWTFKARSGEEKEEDVFHYPTHPEAENDTHGPASGTKICVLA